MDCSDNAIPSVYSIIKFHLCSLYVSHWRKWRISVALHIVFLHLSDFQIFVGESDLMFLIKTQFLLWYFSADKLHLMCITNTKYVNVQSMLCLHFFYMLWLHATEFRIWNIQLMWFVCACVSCAKAVCVARITVVSCSITSKYLCFLFCFFLRTEFCMQVYF